MSGWAKIKKAAKYAGVSERTFRTWLKQGMIHSRLPSGTLLVSLTAVDKFLEAYEVQANEVDNIVAEIEKNLQQ